MNDKIHRCRNLSLAGALAASLVAGLGQAAAEEVVVGAYVPITGALAPLGIDMRNGYQIAVDHVATVKGQPVRLVVEDTQANASRGLQRAQKLVLQDRANVLIGGASSAVVLAINAQADRLNVPIVTTNSQAVQTTGEQCSRYLFRTVPNDAMQARANEQLLKHMPELAEKKWFVVYHDFVWGVSNKEEFKKVPGVNVVGETGRPLGTADWSSAIAQIQASGADAIYLALLVGDDMPAFIRQAKSFGLDHFMLPPLGMPDSMLQALGDDGVGLLTGALFATWTTAEENELMARFVEDYHARFGMVPGPQAILGYAGLRWALAAMEAADSLSTDDVIASLKRTTVDTVIGPLGVRSEDHQGMMGTYIAEAVRLPEPKYGADVAWKVIEQVPWENVMIDLADTGCPGL